VGIPYSVCDPMCVLIGSPLDSRCQSLNGQAQFPRLMSSPEPHVISGIGYFSYRVAFGFHMQEPDWSGWKSQIPSGIRYVSYRVAFGFQMPELEWPGAVSPIDCPPEPHHISGIGYFSYRVAFGIQIQEPAWSGCQYFSYRVTFGFQMPEMK
jgi:hypothetical protein